MIADFERLAYDSLHKAAHKPQLSLSFFEVEFYEAKLSHMYLIKIEKFRMLTAPSFRVSSCAY